MVVTTDPATLPDRSTWYLATNLPAPGSPSAAAPGALPAADLAEVVRLYGLRMWVEQADKQTKHALGWSQYQVRADPAIRRHWQLVCCAFCFGWWHAVRAEQPPPAPADPAAGRGEIAGTARPRVSWPQALRAVRAWLEPWILLRRWWRAWAAGMPPPPLAHLLRALRRGQGLDLYASP